MFDCVTVLCLPACLPACLFFPFGEVFVLYFILLLKRRHFSPHAAMTERISQMRTQQRMQPGNMGPGRKLLNIFQGDRSMEYYARDFIGVASQLRKRPASWPFFWGGLAEPFKSRMPYWHPEESLEEYIDLALSLSGSAFRMEPAPFCEPTESAPEPAPFREPIVSAPEPAPFWEPTHSAPFREPTHSIAGAHAFCCGSPHSPLHSGSPHSPLQSPLQRPHCPVSPQSLLQCLLRPVSPQSPLQSPLRPVIPRSPLREPTQSAPEPTHSAPFQEPTQSAQEPAPGAKRVRSRDRSVP